MRPSSHGDFVLMGVGDGPNKGSTERHHYDQTSSRPVFETTAMRDNQLKDEICQQVISYPAVDKIKHECGFFLSSTPWLVLSRDNTPSSLLGTPLSYEHNIEIGN
jgi:hypothetical protein